MDACNLMKQMEGGVAGYSPNVPNATVTRAALSIFFLLIHFYGQSAKFLSWFLLGFQVNAGLPGWIS